MTIKKVLTLLKSVTSIGALGMLIFGFYYPGQVWLVPSALVCAVICLSIKVR